MRARIRWSSVAKPILSTHDYPGISSWVQRVEAIDRRDLSRVALLRRLVAAGSRYDAVVVNGSVGRREAYVDLVAALALSRRPRGPAVVVSEATWKLGAARADRALSRAAARAIDSPRVAYCVLSSDERAIFARNWRVDEERVFATPYRVTLEPGELEAPTSEDGGVFAGGDSLRDYAPLLDAARRIPARFTLATGRVHGEGLPGNVTAGRVSHERFFELMRGASVVVVPLQDRDDRSAGQQTYLNAMALGKLVIATDALGVREYVEHEVTGLVVPPGDAGALAEAIRWGLDPGSAEERRRITERARAVARERYSLERYAETLLAVVDQVLARRD